MIRPSNMSAFIFLSASSLGHVTPFLSVSPTSHAIHTISPPSLPCPVAPVLVQLQQRHALLPVAAHHAVIEHDAASLRDVQTVLARDRHDVMADRSPALRDAAVLRAQEIDRVVGVIDQIW